MRPSPSPQPPVTGELVLAGPALRDAPESRVGGKAAGLLRLARTGATVPSFAVVAADAFARHVADPEIAEAIDAAARAVAAPDDGALDAASARVRDLVERRPVDAALRAELEAALDALAPGPWAVRSSMVGEDSAAHSFAGQLRTSLFQRTLDDVLDAVRTCWASAFSASALRYGASAGLDPRRIAVAVVLQTMVDADVAGVAFTANPVTGARDEVVITTVLGGGEGVVGDLVPADEYVWTAEEGERSATVATKDARIVAADDGAGTVSRPVPAAERDRRALSPDGVAAVARLAQAVAADAGRPVDVEWCLADGRLYAVQARPVTVLPPDPAAAGRTRVFDNANIQESFNGVTTPLTFSFATRLYEGVYSTLVRHLGASAATREAFAPVARDLLGLVDGRVYYNLESWRHLIEILPGGRRRVGEVESIMFRTTIGTSEGGGPAGVGARAAQAAEAARMLGRLARTLRAQDAIVDRYVERFERFRAGVDRDRLGERSLDELAALLERFRREVVLAAAPSYLNDIRMAIASGRLRALVAEHAPEADVDRRLADLLGGIAGLESVEPTRRLLAIARDARRDAGLADALRAAPPERIPALLAARAPALARAVDDYVERYGDRTIGELKLENRSARDDPRFVGTVLRNYLDAPEVDIDATLAAERRRAGEALADLQARVPRWRRAVLAREVALARRAVSCRERLRLRRTLAFGIARDLYRAMGARLAEAGALDDPSDVLFLSVEEVDAFVAGRAVSTDLRPLVAARRAEHAEHLRRDPGDRIEVEGSPYLARRATAADAEEAAGGATLRGLGCCAGVVEAPVRVILDPSESLSVGGEILCTVRTDPGWAPLFPTASGLLVERGSILSHSAVVARELGIPTVVGVPGVTRTLRSGERLRLDGGTGVVVRLDAEADDA